MRRPIAFVGFALLALACTPHVAAQQRYASGNIADKYAKEGKAQVARAKKYMSAPKTRAYMSSTRPGMNHGTVDPGGRYDMAGKVPPAYFKVRDQSPLLSSRNSTATASRPPATRTHSYPKAATLAPTTVGRRAALDSIPPPPR